MNKIFASKKFQKQFSKLPKNVKRQLNKEIEKLKNGSNIEEPLKGDLEGLCSLHVKNYRVIYSIKENGIYLAVVGHRSNVYEDLKRYLKTT